MLELKGPVGQMIQTDNRGLLAVEKNKVRKLFFHIMAHLEMEFISIPF